MNGPHPLTCVIVGMGTPFYGLSPFDVGGVAHFNTKLSLATKVAESLEHGPFRSLSVGKPFDVDRYRAFIRWPLL